MPNETNTSISAERVKQAIRNRFNPLRNITPQRVVQYIEEFRVGHLREAAWAMECVEECDDVLKSVAPKRKKSVARLDWAIVEIDGATEKYGEDLVQRQRNTLEHFYNNVRAGHAIERNQRGGLQLLIRQMMDAVGKKYSVHEIAWKSDSSGQLTAQFTHVPLWFFENTDGSLKFLENEGQSTGVKLEDNAWMVTVGEGLMITCLIAYIYKTLPLKDWLTYSDRNGMPVFTMKTTAAYGSSEWQDAVNMVQAIAAEFAGVLGQGTEFEVTALSGGGTLPYPALVERMDRAMASLWRGADLSTISGANNMGASLQQSETDILEDDDVDNINETFNVQIDPVVLSHVFGPDAPQTVYFQLKSPDRLDEKAELDKIDMAVRLGARIPVSYLHERFSLPTADEGEPTLTASGASSWGLTGSPMTTAANALLNDSTALAALAAARANDALPVRHAISQLENARTPEEFAVALDVALAVTSAPTPPTAASMVLERLLADALVAGATDHSKFAAERATL